MRQTLSEAQRVFAREAQRIGEDPIALMRLVKDKSARAEVILKLMGVERNALFPKKPRGRPKYKLRNYILTRVYARCYWEEFQYKSNGDEYSISINAIPFSEEYNFKLRKVLSRVAELLVDEQFLLSLGVPEGTYIGKGNGYKGRMTPRALQNALALARKAEGAEGFDFAPLEELEALEARRSNRL